MESAAALGVSQRSILLRHILPNISGPILVTLTFSIPSAILAESTLSFIGIGINDPYSAWGTSWGTLAQDGYTFTDLSPSGNVVPLNTRLNFQHLDTETALVMNLPWPGWMTGTRILSDPALIEASLSGRDLEIYRDHAGAPAAHHLVVQRGGRSCYVMFRRDRRKRLPLFASILHVGDPELFRPLVANLLVARVAAELLGR